MLDVCVRMAHIVVIETRNGVTDMGLAIFLGVITLILLLPIIEDIADYRESVREWKKRGVW